MDGEMVMGFEVLIVPGLVGTRAVLQKWAHSYAHVQRQKNMFMYHIIGEMIS